MSFFVDVVTEDSFYENLTLGVTRILENTPCVKNVRIERRKGSESGVITSWEQRHCCVLPEDLRNFYVSIDGFLLFWNLEIAGEEFPVGRMEIGSLSSVKRYASTVKERPSTCSLAQESTESEAEGENGSEPENSTTGFPSGSSRDCKIFEISQCFPESGHARVYLVYRSKPEQEQTSIWLHREEADRWYHLADSFTVYFRMMLVHLGLPLWQCCVTGASLPTWVEQVYYLVAPQLLPAVYEPTQSISTSLWNNGPPNVLDSTLFKGKDSKQRISRKK